MPDELTDAQLSELHQALEDLHARLERGLSNEADGSETVDLDQPIGRLSRMDALQQQQMVQAQRRRAVHRKELVARALERFAKDDYGFCPKCGEPIGWKRLQARPESPLCVPCTTEMEGRGR